MLKYDPSAGGAGDGALTYDDFAEKENELFIN